MEKLSPQRLWLLHLFQQPKTEALNHRRKDESSIYIQLLKDRKWAVSRIFSVLNSSECVWYEWKAHTPLPLPLPRPLPLPLPRPRPLNPPRNGAPSLFTLDTSSWSSRHSRSYFWLCQSAGRRNMERNFRQFYYLSNLEILECLIFKDQILSEAATRFISSVYQTHFHRVHLKRWHIEAEVADYPEHTDVSPHPAAESCTPPVHHQQLQTQSNTNTTD